MVANYYGGWTHDDDIQLVEVVLRNVRNGNTVVQGCEEYEKLTNGKRSVSASKYRFHTQLKEKYAKAYEMARKEGKKSKKERNVPPKRLKKVSEIVGDENNELTFDDVMLVVNQYRKQKEKSDPNMKAENERLKFENDKLKAELLELEKTLEQKTEREKNIMSALKVLENAGININIPQTKYAVNKDGTIEKI